MWPWWEMIPLEDFTDEDADGDDDGGGDDDGDGDGDGYGDGYGDGDGRNSKLYIDIAWTLWHRIMTEKIFICLLPAYLLNLVHFKKFKEKRGLKYKHFGRRVLTWSYKMVEISSNWVIDQARHRHEPEKPTWTLKANIHHNHFD